jgi:hypothetical protein
MKVVGLEKLHNFHTEHCFIQALDHREILFFRLALVILENHKTTLVSTVLLPPSAQNWGAAPCCRCRRFDLPAGFPRPQTGRATSTRRQPLLPPPLFLCAGCSCARHAAAPHHLAGPPLDGHSHRRISPTSPGELTPSLLCLSLVFSGYK